MSTRGGSAYGGKIEAGLAIFDFRGTYPPRFQNLFAWKALMITVIILFSLVWLPWQGGAETDFTTDNILAVVNEARVREGLGPLKRSVKLEQAARSKAEHIFKEGYFAHTSPSGVKPWNFIKDAGLRYSFAGENLAINYTNTYELVRALMDSPSHRDNLLSPLFSEAGITVVRGRYLGQEAVVTVQMFARPIN